MRTTFLFNEGWKFHRGDFTETNHQAIHANRFKRAEWMKAGNHGISRLGYPDEEWHDVNLPHDFVVAGEYTSTANAVHGSLPTDVAWYRKTFEIPPDLRCHRIHLEFDGIYRDATVWVNGHLAGNHHSGYTSFSLDVTELCDPNEYNAIAIRCDAREFELWSYEGGGIYRDVRLVATEDLYVPYSGTCIRSKFPDVTDHSRVQIELQAKIHNAGREDREAQMIFKIFDNTSDSLVYESSQSSQIAAGTKTTINHQLEIAHPKLWSVASPLLYRLESHVQIGGKSTDIYS